MEKHGREWARGGGVGGGAAKAARARTPRTNGPAGRCIALGRLRGRFCDRGGKAGKSVGTAVGYSEEPEGGITRGAAAAGLCVEDAEDTTEAARDNAARASGGALDNVTAAIRRRCCMLYVNIASLRQEPTPTMAR